MRKGGKKNIGFIISVASIAAVVGGICIAICSLTPPDEDKMEEYFKRDKNDFAVITEYLADSSYSYITINKSDSQRGTMFTGADTQYEKIEDEAVIDALNRLFRDRGYRLVGRDNDTIFFQKWAHFEKERGIAYLLNGEDKPVIEFMVKAEMLSEEGWFYYETDYEEFRS